MSFLKILFYTFQDKLMMISELFVGILMFFTIRTRPS